MWIVKHRRTNYCELVFRLLLVFKLLIARAVSSRVGRETLVAADGSGRFTTALNLSNVRLSFWFDAFTVAPLAFPFDGLFAASFVVHGCHCAKTAATSRTTTTAPSIAIFRFAANQVDIPDKRDELFEMGVRGSGMRLVRLISCFVMIVKTPTIGTGRTGTNVCARCHINKLTGP